MADHNHVAHGIPINECGFDEAILKLVHLSRFYFTAYAAGESPDCETAVEMCREQFGKKYAVEIAIGLLCVLGAMRESRRSKFQYNSATCKQCRNRISECERLLFSTLHSAREGRMSRAHVTAMMLCEGNDIEPLFKAIKQLNGFLGRVSDSLKKI